MLDRVRTALLIAGVAVLALVAGAPAWAAQTGAGIRKTAASVEQVIITELPARQSRVRNFLLRLVGSSSGTKLVTTGTEVVTIPKAKSAWLVKQLERLGCKAVRVRESWQHILARRKSVAGLTAVQEAVVSKIAKLPETVKVGMLTMRNAAVAELVLTRFEQSVGMKGRAGLPGDRFARVVLPVGDHQDVALVRTRPPVVTAKGITWTGEVEETGERAVLMLWRDGHLSGYFGYKGRIFVVSHVGDKVHALAEVDPGKLPPDHVAHFSGNHATRDASPLPVRPAALPPEPVVAPFPDAVREALEAKEIVIDIMLLYTPNAAKHYIRNPSDLLELAIEQANETFRNSGVGNVSLRLVHSQAVDYDERGADQFDTLYRMVDQVGVFKGVKKLRDEKRADIVGLIIDDPNGCGLSTRVGADAEEAFFVVHHSCAAITYSIGHEVGHILGARHDRFIDGNETPFPYGHGYVNGAKWRDMMSYRESCGGCPRIPYWSNPRIMYRGEPTGTPASDNARVILQQAERVANFR